MTDTSTLSRMAEQAEKLAQEAGLLAAQTAEAAANPPLGAGIDPLVFGITVFVLACFVGYFVVWKVTPSLHTPLMAVTNAISGIVIVGAILAMGSEGANLPYVLGFLATLLAAVNIFGGFVVTQRMLGMFRKKG